MAFPRFRLRSLMLVLALGAIPLGFWCETERTRQRFGGRAVAHRARINGLGVGAGPGSRGYRLIGFKQGGLPLIPEESVRDEWHFALFLKNSEAAQHPWPWRRNAPDPPEPRWPGESAVSRVLRSKRLHDAVWRNADRLGVADDLAYARLCWSSDREVRIYRALISAGDPNREYCRRHAESAAQLKRWARQRLFDQLGRRLPLAARVSRALHREWRSANHDMRKHHDDAAESFSER